jgi:hypothetical protein
MVIGSGGIDRDPICDSGYHKQMNDYQPRRIPQLMPRNHRGTAMKPIWLTVAAPATVLAVVSLLLPVASSLTKAQTITTAPSFLQVGSCYDFVLSVPSPPYKLLELSEPGWALVEIEAGPAGPSRSRLWINLSTVIGVRSMKCSW